MCVSVCLCVCLLICLSVSSNTLAVTGIPCVVLLCNEHWLASSNIDTTVLCTHNNLLKGISAEFQVIRGFSQRIPADLLSYDKIHS